MYKTAGRERAHARHATYAPLYTLFAHAPHYCRAKLRAALRDTGTPLRQRLSGNDVSILQRGSLLLSSFVVAAFVMSSSWLYLPMTADIGGTLLADITAAALACGLPARLNMFLPAFSLHCLPAYSRRCYATTPPRAASCLLCISL